MAYIDDVAREVHMKYYNRGFLDMENEEIREICEITHTNKEKAKEALAKYRHPITREEKRAAKEKQKLIRNKVNDETKKYISQNMNREKIYQNNENFINEFNRRQAEKNIAQCPRCKSTSLAYDSKKLSVGRGIVGGLVGGAIGGVQGESAGIILGGLSSKKGYAVCLNCGKRWKI